MRGNPPLRRCQNTLSLFPEPPGRILFDAEKRIVTIEQFEDNESAEVSDAVTIPEIQWPGVKNKIDAMFERRS